MKIDAGWKFQRRNPSSAPARAKHRTATNGWLVAVVSEIRPEGDRRDQRDARRQAVEPVDEVDAVDHPDDPDQREPDRVGPDEDDVVGAERVVDEGHGDPGHDGERGERDLAQQLPASAELERVVEHADQGGDGAAEEEADELGRVDRARDRARCRAGRWRRGRRGRRRGTRWRRAMPPPRGIGRLLTRRGSGRSTLSRRIARRRTSGVMSSAISAAATNATTRSGSTSPNVPIRRIGWSGVAPRAAPAPGSGPPARGPRRGSGRGRPRRRDGGSRPTIQPPDLRISSGPMPRVVVAGVPTRIPDATLGGLRVERDRVLVDGDADLVEQRLGLAARDAQRRHVDEHQVVVGAAADRAGRPRSASGLRRGPPAFSIVRRLVAPEVARSAASRNATALAATTCISGPPWTPGKTDLSIACAERLFPRREVGAVDAVGQVLAAEDHAAARPAQRLVGGGGDEVRVRERARVQARGHEAGDVRHVDEQQRADAVGDRRHPLEVDDPRIGGGARDDDLRADLVRLRLERVVVDPLGPRGSRRRRGPRTGGPRS